MNRHADPSEPTPQARQIAQFLAGKAILIADSHGSSRAGIAKCLTALGAHTAKIELVTDFDRAREALLRLKPPIVITDFALGSRSGLELSEACREAGMDPAETLFIVVTGNATQAAVAEAAEGDVDAYILKPYTLEKFNQILIRAALTKIQPSDYLRLLQQGKSRLAAGSFEEALRLFDEAARHDSKPCLAMYCRAQVFLAQKRLAEARKSLEQGMVFHPLHYRCLVGLFELLILEHKLTEAYAVGARLSEHFPTHAKRLSQLVKLAVATGNFEDIDEFYESFKALDTRSEELVRHICAGLTVAGKHFFQHALRDHAVATLHNAAVSAGGRGPVLRKIVLTLLEHGELKEAQLAIQRFLPGEAEGADCQLCRLALEDAATPDARQVIHSVRQALEKGLKEPLAYEILVRRYAELGKLEQAEEYAAEAGRLWPSEKARFAGLFKPAPAPAP